MKQYKKILMTLVALLAVTTGAWAQDTYTIMFKANGNTKTVENVTLPKTYQSSYDNADGELDLILKELYGWTGNKYETYCSYDTGDTPTSSDPSKVAAGLVDDVDHYITIDNAFEGTVTVSGVYWVKNDKTNYSLEISIPGYTTWNAETKTASFTMPDYDVEVLVEYYDELMDGDEDDNTSLLASLNGKTTDIYLDRTLAKEKWYTLCLPFAVDLTAEGPLKGVTAKTLSSVTNDGTTVTVTFGEAVTSLAAGTPYIVRLPEDAAADLIDPLFEGATISNELYDVAVTGGTFKGTYARVDWNAPNTKVLFLQDNKFLYPDPSAHVNAFRGYIELAEDVPVSAGAKIILDFGDDASGIETVDVDAQQDGIWYTLQGIQLDGKPTEKGIYILNGKKVVVK
jgi:hypothetical protein